MQFLLLTGAGFTRNWGAWLAKELEGDLLARLAPHESLRTLIQNSSNYEQALQIARTGGQNGIAVSPNELTIFEEAIRESFWAMNVALAQRISLFLNGESERDATSLLSKFDAIFTLNQDLLLEFHYQPRGKWRGSYYPGIEPSVPVPLDGRQVVQMERRVGSIVEDPDRQPIYKLHGSAEWTDGTESLFVVGGGKSAYVQSKPLLTRYFTTFEQMLATPQTRLMIIGYGFADDHVNDILVKSSHKNPSLGVYFIHPEGREAIYRGSRERAIVQAISPLADLRCIGESRRPLTSTFGGDKLEYEKVMRFFG